MGDLESIQALLKSNFDSMQKMLQMHQQMLLSLQSENQELKTQVKRLQTTSSDPLQYEVLQKVKRNKKRMIKNKILETIKFKSLSIPEIKEIIVDQHRYCSKASFYRYVEELKMKDFVHLANDKTLRIKPLVETV